MRKIADGGNGTDNDDTGDGYIGDDVGDDDDGGGGGHDDDDNDDDDGDGDGSRGRRRRRRTRRRSRVNRGGCPSSLHDDAKSQSFWPYSRYQTVVACMNQGGLPVRSMFWKIRSYFDTICKRGSLGDLPCKISDFVVIT